MHNRVHTTLRKSQQIKGKCVSSLVRPIPSAFDFESTQQSDRRSVRNAFMFKLIAHAAQLTEWNANDLNGIPLQ